NLSHELRHQTFEVCALADGMTMRAMRAGHGVVLSQCQTGSDDRGLLPNARVVGTGNVAGFEESCALLFELPDPEHASVGFVLLYFGERHSGLSVLALERQCSGRDVKCGGSRQHQDDECAQRIAKALDTQGGTEHIA